MTESTITPARGKVIAVRDGNVVFAPSGTNYELQLVAPGYTGPVNVVTEGVIRVTARKVLTVPSGGNFISPIFGQPRTIQGRVRALSAGAMVVQAGAAIVVDLPDSDRVYDLANGPITVGALVNVIALPGAAFEWAAADRAAAAAPVANPTSNLGAVRAVP